jgi:hypothetical protein
MSCPVQSSPIPNDACGPGSSLTPLEPLPTPQSTRYQQPGACPLPTGDPILDPDNLLLPLSLSWVQQTPWDPARPVYVDSHPWTGGWSMLPSRGYGCNIGGYCPYACRAPYYETQWDNAWAGSAYWSLSTGDPTPSFIGFGRRYVWRVAAFLACHSTISGLPPPPPPFKPSSKALTPQTHHLQVYPAERAMHGRAAGHLLQGDRAVGAHGALLPSATELQRDVCPGP